MARRVEYYCDECKTLFGDKPHINVKGGDIRLSYLNTKQEWRQKNFPVKCKEYHFCQPECLSHFLYRMYIAVMDEIKPKGETNESKETQSL